MYNRFRSLDALDVRGRRVLVRVDLNLPMKDGKISDRTRLVRAASTIRTLADRGARVVLISHFGRPKKGRDPAMSLEPMVPALQETLRGHKVSFCPDCVGPQAEEAAAALQNGEVLLLENLRFHAEEEGNGQAFAEGLARLADLYVNDAFSVSHRAHASIERIATLLPPLAGKLMMEELIALWRSLESPERPVLAVVGGAKVSTKIELLKNLVPKVDALLIGGGMANTFLHAMGQGVGTSLCEKDFADTAEEILAIANAHYCQILLPRDVVVAREFKAGAECFVVPATAVPDDMMILDFGPDSVADIVHMLDGFHTVVWNGPLGAFEIPPFDQATVALAQAVATRTESGQLASVAGGGDTVAALVHAHVDKRFSYVSTAGGAFLEWLEGCELPGVAALERGAAVVDALAAKAKASA